MRRGIAGPGVYTFGIIMVAIVLLLFASQEIIFGADNNVVDVAYIQQQAREAKDIASNAYERINKLEKNISLGSAIIVLLIGIAGVFGYKHIKNWIQDYVEKQLANEINRVLGDSLPRILSDTQQRVEDYLLRLARLLTLRAQSEYDVALAEFGWDGNVINLRKETPSIRRAIIDCLYGSRLNRAANREAAWGALTELSKEDGSIETIRLYLRLSISMRKYNDGVAYLELNKDKLLKDKEAGLKASTLLRKIGKIESALQVLKDLGTEDDLQTLVAAAVLERDLGRFDKVHDRLLPAVGTLIASHTTTLPEGWHRLLNTFIANCIDREHPEDALTTAEYVLRSAPGPVEIFTVGRIILLLPERNPKKTELFARFRESVNGLLPGEATTRCKVIIEQVQGNIDNAIKFLRDEIENGTQTGEPMNQNIYYFRCSLGEILIDGGRTDEAIDVLMPAAGYKYGGEAKYNLALAYGKQNRGPEAALWLREAYGELPKWAVHARDNNILKNISQVTEFLSSVS